MFSVLYVDDNADLLELGKLYLEATGDFSVITTDSADSALAMLRERSFDLILSDFDMPGMNGIGFLTEVRARYRDIPFILFTGRGHEEIVVEAINHGADFYLQKGGDVKAQFAELSHKIRQAVRRQRAETALAESRDYLDKIFTSVKAGILVIDAAAHTIIDNPLLVAAAPIRMRNVESGIAPPTIVDENRMTTKISRYAQIPYDRIWSVMEVLVNGRRIVMTENTVYRQFPLMLYESHYAEIFCSRMRSNGYLVRFFLFQTVAWPSSGISRPYHENLDLHLFSKIILPE